MKTRTVLRMFVLVRGPQGYYLLVLWLVSTQTSFVLAAVVFINAALPVLGVIYVIHTLYQFLKKARHYE